jgi:hypothetical protein
MWKKEMDPLTKMKIECFAANQLILVIDGMVLMMTEKLYSKVLLIFAMLFMACSNVYVYYREVKKSEMADKLNEEVANKILENVENDK